MFSRIKRFFGFDQSTPVQASEPEKEVIAADSLAAVPKYIEDLAMREAWAHNNRYYRLLNVWYYLKNIKNRLQKGIVWIFKKIYNTAFYIVAFSITLALSASTTGFLSVGNFGLAALTIIPTYIAFRSTGPIYDVIDKITNTIVPPVVSAVLYVVKTIGAIVLAHCLRVTGMADYSRTVKPGEFFGKANLPTFNAANRDDELEPNPDLNTNAAVYGPDLDLGPLSFGTSIRFTWSLIKYIKNAPQYIKYGLNWAMKKSGLEEFARNVDTPSLQKEHKDVMSDEGLTEIIMSDIIKLLPEKKPQFTAIDYARELNLINIKINAAKERIEASNRSEENIQLQPEDERYSKITDNDIDHEVKTALETLSKKERNNRVNVAVVKYRELINGQINDEISALSLEIDTYLKSFKNTKNIPISDIKSIIDNLNKKQDEYIKSEIKKFQDVLNVDNNIGIVVLAAEFIDYTEPAFKAQKKYIKLIDEGVIAKEKIYKGINDLKGCIAKCRNSFEDDFKQEIAAATAHLTVAPTPLRLHRCTSEELKNFEEAKLEKARQSNKSAHKFVTLYFSESAIALQQEEETKALQQQEEYDNKYRSRQQQVFDDNCTGKGRKCKYE